MRPRPPSTGSLSRLRAVEPDIGRWKRVIGHALRSQTDKRQATDVAIAVDVLNRLCHGNGGRARAAGRLPERYRATAISEPCSQAPVPVCLDEVASQPGRNRAADTASGSVPSARSCKAELHGSQTR